MATSFTVYLPAQDMQPHRVARLYYMAPDERLLKGYQDVFGALTMNIDGAERRTTAWPDWAITTRVDATR